MLRQAQHERRIPNDFRLRAVRPEPVEGRRCVFSLHFKKDSLDVSLQQGLYSDCLVVVKSLLVRAHQKRYTSTLRGELRAMETALLTWINTLALIAAALIGLYQVRKIAEALARVEETAARNERLTLVVLERLTPQ